MTDQTTKAIARQAVADFKAAERKVRDAERKVTSAEETVESLRGRLTEIEVSSVLAAGDAVSRWVKATGSAQGTFPAKGTRWESAGSLSKLVKCFGHFGIDSAKAAEVVTEARSTPGKAKLGVLNAMYASFASTGRTNATSTTAEGSSAAKAGGGSRKASAKREATPHDLVVALGSVLDQVTDEDLNSLIAMLKTQLERRAGRPVKVEAAA